MMYDGNKYFPEHEWIPFEYKMPDFFEEILIHNNVKSKPKILTAYLAPQCDFVHECLEKRERNRENCSKCEQGAKYDFLIVIVDYKLRQRLVCPSYYANEWSQLKRQGGKNDEDDI